MKVGSLEINIRVMLIGAVFFHIAHGNGIPAENSQTKEDTTTLQPEMQSDNIDDVTIPNGNETEEKISKMLVALSGGEEEKAYLDVTVRTSEDIYKILKSVKGEALESMDANGDTACFFSHVYGTRSRMTLRCFVAGEEAIVYDVNCLHHRFHPHVHLDPFAQNVYWRHGETGEIWVTSVKTNASTLVHKATQKWKDNSAFVVDPFEKRIFWSINANDSVCAIGIQNLGASESVDVVLQGALQNETLCAKMELALDLQGKSVYWLTQHYLSVGSFNGTILKEFPLSDNQSKPLPYQVTGLKYFDNELFWVEHEPNSFSIVLHSFHLSSNTSIPEIENMNCSISENYTSAQFLIYGKGPQNLTNPCANARCSHLCMIKSESDAVCYCPLGMELLKSNRYCEPTRFGLISTESDHAVMIITETKKRVSPKSYKLSVSFDPKSPASAVYKNLARICYAPPKEACSCFHCQRVTSEEAHIVFNITEGHEVKALYFHGMSSRLFSISTGKNEANKDTWCVGKTIFNPNATWSEILCLNESLKVSVMDPDQGILYYFDQVNVRIKAFNLSNNMEPRGLDINVKIEKFGNISQIFFDNVGSGQLIGIGDNWFWIHNLVESSIGDFHYFHSIHPNQFAYQNNRLYWSEKTSATSNSASTLKSYSLITKMTEETTFPVTTFRRFFLGRVTFDKYDRFKAQQEPYPSRRLLYGLLIVVVALVSSVLTYVGGKYYSSRQDRQIHETANNFLFGSSEAVDDSWTEMRKARYLPFTKILTARLKIDRSKELGRGHTTVVYKGEVGMRGNTVAVKTILSTNDFESLDDLLRELKIVAFAGDHPNLLRFLNADISHIRGGGIYAVYENSTLGCLKNYLMRMPYTVPDPELTDNENKEWKRALRRSNFDACSFWTRQIANGMAYLAERNIVHGDLRTKNIYVFPGNVVKITNFGLPGIIYRYAHEEDVDKTLLPWQWMSIQALQYKEFTEASDVWAYAVTLWEIFSMGEEPYKGKIWDEDFVKDLRNGIKLNKPILAPVRLYEKIMVACWKFTPPQRPHFSNIIHDLNTLD